MQPQTPLATLLALDEDAACLRLCSLSRSVAVIACELLQAWPARSPASTWFVVSENVFTPLRPLAQTQFLVAVGWADPQCPWPHTRARPLQNRRGNSTPRLSVPWTLRGAAWEGSPELGWGWMDAWRGVPGLRQELGQGGYSGCRRRGLGRPGELQAEKRLVLHQEAWLQGTEPC